jgi:hypothetical protein
VVTVDNLDDTDIDLLAQNCRDETQKFYQGLVNDTRYCFELLRRAYVDLVEQAILHVYKIYLPMLVYRAQHHGLFYASCQDANYFGHLALARFYNTNRGEKFLKKFEKLESVIAYLYMCLHSVIVHDVRTNASTISVDDNENLMSGDILDESHLNAQDLWKHIRGLLTDTKDIQLAYLRFVLAMMPAEIMRSYPSMWDDERAISVALQRIRRKLRSDPGLRDLAGLYPETDPSDE